MCNEEETLHLVCSKIKQALFYCLTNFQTSTSNTNSFSFSNNNSEQNSSIGQKACCRHQKYRFCASSKKSKNCVYDIGSCLTTIMKAVKAKHYYLARYHISSNNGDANHINNNDEIGNNSNSNTNNNMNNINKIINNKINGDHCEKVPFIVSSDVEHVDDLAFQPNETNYYSIDILHLVQSTTVLYFVFQKDDTENNVSSAKGRSVLDTAKDVMIKVLAKIITDMEYDIPYLLKRTAYFSDEKIKKQLSRSFSVVSLNSDVLFEHLVSLFYRSKSFNKITTEVDFCDMVSFLIEIRRRYTNAPYHNWVHAVDVTQFVATIIENVGINNYMEPYEAFAVLFAAICHDVEHTGHNNAFHRKTTTVFATLARSSLPPLESHHAELAMQILHESHQKIIEKVPMKEKIEKIVVDCILATDMEKHNDFVNKFRNTMKNFDRQSEGDRLLLCQIILKAADLSNTVRDFNEAVKMTNQLMTEFFQQGDLESKLGIEISPMCDRNTAGPISKGQIGFYKFVAKPLMGSLNNFFGNLEENEKQFNDNLQQWESMDENTVEQCH